MQIASLDDTTTRESKNYYYNKNWDESL